jgi:transposase-like protein
MTIPTIHKLTPAFDVLERLGGKSAVAAELEVSASTLSRWCQPHPKGTGGLIPQRHWPALIGLAKRRNVKLSVSDLAAVR